MIDEGCKRLKTKYMPVQVQQPAKPAAKDQWPSCMSPSLRGVDCSCGDDCNDWSSSTCMKTNFKKYLHCIGKRVAKCYRQKWIVSKEVINAAPTPMGGCQKEWNQDYHCE